MDTSDTPLGNLSWDMLDRYLAGECSPREARFVRAYLAQHPKVEHLLRHADQLSEQDTVHPSAVEGWKSLARQLEIDGALKEEITARAAQSRAQVNRGVKAGALTRRQFGRVGTGIGSRTLRVGMWVGTLAAVCGLLAILTHRAGEVSRAAARVYATGPVQQATLTLGDGTRVTLAPQTTLRVPPFGPHARTVALERGEAYFEVVHAAGAPFVVRSGAATAQVLGTAFLVRHIATDAHVHVAVADGKVRVTTPGQVDSGITLTSGQSGDITDSTAQVMTMDDQTPDIERAPGRIMFRHTPLATVLQTVSQWYGYQFRYTDATLGARNVTISVSTRSSAEVLAAIEQVLLVNLTVVGDTVTLAPRPSRSHQNAPRIRTYDVWTPTREVGR
jgi:transmembrane sensor